MKIVTAFLDGKILCEYDPPHYPKKWNEWSEGTYFWNKDQQRWHIHTGRYSEAIETNQVPKELRAIVLLLT